MGQPGILFTFIERYRSEANIFLFYDRFTRRRATFLKININQVSLWAEMR